jgi:uncharacterized protein (DUF1501 family)
MNNGRFPSRRNFLRTAPAAPVASAMVGGYSAAAAQDSAEGRLTSIVSRVTLDKELYDCDAVVHGQVHFRLPGA